MVTDSRSWQLAADILDAVRAATPGVHCIRVVDPDEFTHLDLEYYSAAAAAFGRCGFAVLADVQDMSLCEGTGIDTFARLLSGAGGGVTALVVHARPRMAFSGRLKKVVFGDDHPRVAEAFTWFSDDSTLLTTTEPPVSALPSALSDVRIQLEPETLPREVAARHVAAVKQHLAARQGVRIRPVRHLVDFMLAVNAVGERRRDLLAHEAWATREYVQARVGADEPVDAVHTALLKMLREEHARADGVSA